MKQWILLHQLGQQIELYRGMDLTHILLQHHFKSLKEIPKWGVYCIELERLQSKGAIIVTCDEAQFCVNSNSQQRIIR